MAKKSAQKIWEENKQPLIHDEFKKVGLKPNLQMLKMRILRIGYSGVYNADSGDDLNKLITRYNLDRIDDEALLTAIEQLEQKEIEVLEAKFGIKGDGIMIHSKEAAKKVEIPTREFNLILNSVIERLKQDLLKKTSVEV